MNQMKDKVPFFSEGILIGVASLVGYLIAYQFQNGFTAYFSVPNDLVAIDPNQVLLTVVFTVVILYFIGPLLLIMPIYMPIYSKRAKRIWLSLSSHPRRFSLLALSSFIIFVLILVSAFYIGMFRASLKRDFLIIKAKPETKSEMVVLAIYGDHIICAPFDRKTKTIKHNFLLLNKDAEKLPILELERVGPLKSREHRPFFSFR